jgi:hypothetical protein
MGLFCFATVFAWGADVPALTPTERIEKALTMEIDSLDQQEHTLNEWLTLFGKITNENFILDSALPKSVGETKLTVKVQKGSLVVDALGVALSLAGLRYAIMDGAIFVSTEGKLGDRLLSGQGLAQPMVAAKASEPMSVGEAVVRSQPFDRYQDGFIGEADMIASYPYRLWEAPRLNTKTGLIDYPGPPIWFDDPDVNNPRFRYTRTPMFLKPEYLAWEQEKRDLREDQDRRARAERQTNAKALDALLQLLKDNPDLKAKELLEKLGEK